MHCNLLEFKYQTFNPLLHYLCYLIISTVWSLDNITKTIGVILSELSSVREKFMKLKEVINSITDDYYVFLLFNQFNRVN